MIFSYADDTDIIFEHETWQMVKNTAEIGLGLVKNWLESSKHSLDIMKPKYIAFAPNLK